MKRILLFWVAILTLPAPTVWNAVGGQEAQAPLTVEFDAIESPGTIESIWVGYFRPGETAPIRAVQVLPADVVVNGRSMRITVPRLAVEGSGTVVLRLQIVSKGGGRSDWSESTGRVTLPVVPAAERRRAADRPPPPILSAKDLDAHPALKAEFSKRLGTGMSMDDALKAFRRVRDAATAVALSRGQEIALDRLCRSLLGPPRLSLRQALLRLKPSVDTRGALREAQAEGRRLLSPSRPEQPR